MHTDAPTVVNILVGDRHGFPLCNLACMCDIRGMRNRTKHALDSPGQISGRWSSAFQCITRSVQIVAEFGLGRLHGSEIHAKCRACPDEACTPHCHGCNGLACVFHGVQVHYSKPMWQCGLVNHLHNAVILRFEPNGAVVLSIDLHESSPRSIATSTIRACGNTTSGPMHFQPSTRVRTGNRWPNPTRA